MAEGNDYSSIGPLNAAAQKEGFNFLGLIVLDMAAAIVILYIVGKLANALL